MTHTNCTITKEKHWDEELKLYQSLRDTGVTSELILEVQEAFSSDIIGRVLCMDDRLSSNGTIRIAGSGLLLEKKIGKRKLAEVFNKLGVTEITSHNDCGAAKLYIAEKNIKGNEDILSKKILVDFANDHSFKHEYIGDINKPHVARCTFIDTTARFNPNSVNGLPECFVITEKEIPTDHVLEQTKITINIATGDYGFGEKITPEHPFFVVVLGEKGDNIVLDRGLEEIENNGEGKIVVEYVPVV